MSLSSKYFFIITLAVMTLGGCRNGESEPDLKVRKDCPDFTATIGHAAARAFDQSWESGDKIGVSGVDRTNVCYITEEGNGSFTVETPGEQIYFQDESEVTFTAYYPWNNLAEGTETVAADTRDQTAQKSFDFLWAQATGKKDAPTVSFNFAHKMAKVSFTVKKGEGMSYEEVKAASLSLAGFCHTGSFNVSDGSTTIDEDIDEDEITEGWVFTDQAIQAEYNENEGTVTYSLIFFPQVFDDKVTFLAELDLPDDNIYNLRAEIDFTNANSAMDGAEAKNEWVAGRQYNLSMTLHKTEIALVQCEIESWNEVDDDLIVD